MDAFIKGVTDIITGIFTALTKALGSMGDLVFTTGENGAITGPSGFGWLLIVAIGVPLATWIFGKLFTWLKGFARAGR